MVRLAPGTPLHVDLQEGAPGDALPLARLAMDRARVAQLEWTPGALAAGKDIAPLSYPMEPGLHPARSREFDGLHGFLADSLPDAWGTLLLRRRLRRLGHDYDTLSAVDRLALVGPRGRGALVYRPASLSAEDADGIDLDLLASESRAVLLGDESDLAGLLERLGGGSGGARPKLHVGFAADGSIRAGDALEDDCPDDAGGQWIVKFPSLSDPADIGPIEQAYALMARAARIEMAETRLIPSASGPGHFATRRFDRPGGEGRRVHMVSLGGALEASPHMPSLDYDGFLRAVFAITRDVREVDKAFRRMVFNVLAVNRDDHVRQHAFLMDGRGRWTLSPAFDLTFSNGPGGEHYMAVDGEGRAITLAHVQALGTRHGIRPARIDAVVAEVDAATKQWREVAGAAGVERSAKGIAEALDARRIEYFGG